MNSDSQSAPNFDRLAGPYRWLEYLSFGPLLWRCRVYFLPQLGLCRGALVLGDGDGRFTAELLCSNPQVTVHAVDLSPTMIQTAQRAAKAHSRRITTEIADLRTWSPGPAAGYDLIVSHFFLDCLTSREVDDLAQRLAGSAAPGTLWVVSDFAVPRTPFGALVAKPLVSGLYLAFRWLTGLQIRALPDHAQSLTAAGWLMRSERPWLNGLLVSQLWQRPTIPAGFSSDLK
jgi:cyclopropane fatty-acyl-phospholipid synthase-like methyltransferase